MAFVEENDLSSTLDRPGETGHPEVRTAVERVCEAARANDVTTGIAGRTSDAADRRAGRGFRFFLVGGDLSFTRRGVEKALSE